MRTRMGVIAVTLTLAVVGCSSTGDRSIATDTTSPTVTFDPSYTEWPTNLPESVVTRTPLPDCGLYERKADESDVAALDCFWNAYDTGQAAEVRTLIPTGDTQPIAMYYRTIARNKNEAIHISHQGMASKNDCYELVRRGREQVDCSVRPFSE